MSTDKALIAFTQDELHTIFNALSSRIRHMESILKQTTDTARGIRKTLREGAIHELSRSYALRARVESQFDYSIRN